MACASTRPRLVCFDLGGVVVRICRSFEEAALAAGVPLRPTSLDAAALARRRALIDRHQLGAMNASSFHRAMSEAFDGVYTMHEIARVHAAVLCGEYEEIAVTIERIAQSGLRTACLSNTNDEHWQTLLEFRAVKALHHRHASHLWGLAKPESSIYHRFEREVGCTGFDILFFDDLPENVASAIACGWDARLIDHTGNTAQQVCDALAERGVALQVASPRPA